MQKNIRDNLQLNVSLIDLLRRLFNLKADTDKIGTIDLIKSNVEFQSANAWTLVFAILIASVGLNVNSTAVIIGAMLISPLMGPIVGVGLSLGTYDFVLLKKSAKNLAAAVLISIVASTIYFLLSPLSEVQSELLARTRPSFFDVLIAFFGGAAGIVAISRKEKGNAIPGVAIATALMPPLCTAGFGLATRNFSFFFGAMYLFIINSVFISISTFLFVRYLGFHISTNIDSKQHRNINRWITYVGITVLIPSFFMAWYLQRESFFRSQADKYITRELRSEKSLIVEQEISYSLKAPKIKVTILGEPVSEDELNNLKAKAQLYSISPEAVEIRQSTFSEKLVKKIGEKMSSAENFSNELQMKLKQNEAELNSFKNLHVLSLKVSQELTAVFPRAVSVLVNKDVLSKELEPPSTGTSDINPELKVLVRWQTTPAKPELAKATEFLSKRLGADKNNILHLRNL